jgi:hypothetical protein
MPLNLLDLYVFLYRLSISIRDATDPSPAISPNPLLTPEIRDRLSTPTEISISADELEKICLQELQNRAKPDRAMLSSPPRRR